MLSVSKGNIKMGDIASISLPAVKTCADGVPCAKKCYALRMMKRRACIRNAYENNLKLWYELPQLFEMEAIVAAMNQQIFRWHVSGDIPNMKYLEMMVRVAEKCKNTRFFAFTKKFSLVNEYLKKNGKFPKNLKIIFSAWKGLNMDNPFNLPVAHVIEKDGSCTAKKIKNVCCGNCQQCMLNGQGCWNLRKGQIVCFGIH